MRSEPVTGGQVYSSLFYTISGQNATALPPAEKNICMADKQKEKYTVAFGVQNCRFSTVQIYFFVL
jgi:hypothetical protein